MCANDIYSLCIHLRAFFECFKGSSSAWPACPAWLWLVTVCFIRHAHISIILSSMKRKREREKKIRKSLREFEKKRRAHICYITLKFNIHIVSIIYNKLSSIVSICFPFELTQSNPRFFLSFLAISSSKSCSRPSNQEILLSHRLFSSTYIFLYQYYTPWTTVYNIVLISIIT